MMPEPWSDERLDAAYGVQYGRPAPADLIAATIVAVRFGRAPRVVPDPARRVGLLGIAAVIAVVVVGASALALRFGLYPGGGSVTDGPPGFRTFTGSGIAFDFPDDWTLRDASAAFSGGSAIAVVGTLPVDPLCGLGHIDINCYYEQRLEPGTISIVVATGAYRGGTIFDAERAAPPTVRTTIAGMPALFTDRGHVEGNYYLADLEMSWEIAYPTTPTNVYRVDVGIRGPGTEDFRRQAEALMASLRFTSPPVPLPSDPASDAAAGRAAIAEAEASDRQMWGIGQEVASWYSCFGEDPDTSNDGIVATSPGGHLDPPVSAVCRWTVRREGDAFWRIDLQADWSAGDQTGRVHETRWLSPDGQSVAAAFDGDFPPTTDAEATSEPDPTGSPDPNATVPPTDVPDFEVELVPGGNDQVTVAVYDRSGLLLGARAARPDELNPLFDPIRPMVGPAPTNPVGRPNELAVEWYSWACDSTYTLTFGRDARSLDLDHPPIEQCTQLGRVFRGVVLRFRDDVPAGEVDASILEHTPVVVTSPGAGRQFTLPLLDPLGKLVTVEIEDNSGRLISARSARQDEPFPNGEPPLAGRAIVANPRDRPYELRVAWTGSLCDTTWSLRIETTARSIDIAQEARLACDSVGIGRGVLLTFSEPVPAAEVTVNLGATIVD